MEGYQELPGQTSEEIDGWMVQPPFEQHRQNVAIRKDLQDMNMTTPLLHTNTENTNTCIY